MDLIWNILAAFAIWIASWLLIPMVTMSKVSFTKAAINGFILAVIYLLAKYIN